MATLYSNVTGSTASSVFKIGAVDTFIVHWYGLTGGSFTPQWSVDYGPATAAGTSPTWKDYASGARTAAAGEIEGKDGGIWFRLNGSSMTGGVYAYIAGANVLPA